MSLQSFLDYLSLEKKYSEHTTRAYQNDIESFIQFCTEEYETPQIEKVGYNLIRSWIIVLVEDGIGNRSVNRKIASLKAFYKFLLRIGEIKVNPLSKHKALKTAKKIEVPFSEQEMEAVLSQIAYDEGFEGSRDKLIIEMLYATGIRRAELIHLKIDAIDLFSKTIKVLGKRNKERLVPLLPSTLELIKDYYNERQKLQVIEDMEFVFLLKSGRKIYETLVYRVVNKYLGKVSTKVKKSPHILRHTFATHLLNQGADLNSVKELLGHSSLASTQVYTHNSITELKKVHAASHPRSQE